MRQVGTVENFFDCFLARLDISEAFADYLMVAPEGFETRRKIAVRQVLEHMLELLAFEGHGGTNILANNAAAAAYIIV